MLKDAKLKKMLADCYKVEQSEKQKSFIRKYQRRELIFTELLYIQFKYMWISCAAILILLLGVTAYLAITVDDNAIFLISSIMPFAAIIALIGLGKSSRFGMEELEMATRFSVRMIKSIRLVLVGIAGLLAVGVTSIVSFFFLNMQLRSAALFCAYPYMITTYACMIVIRKWHAKENIIGCVAIAAMVSVFTITKCIFCLCLMLQLSEMTGLLLLLFIVIITAREIYLYLKESEELQWNLC